MVIKTRESALLWPQLFITVAGGDANVNGALGERHVELSPAVILG